MEWVLRSPQIHSTFGSLGFLHGDEYHINEDCNAALETILHNILTEDKYLRTYRRCISFGQNVKKDLIPLLIHARNDKTIELLIRILVNLTIPVECLLSVDIIAKTDVGRHTLFEINNLLSATKNAFTDNRTTKVIFEFLNNNVNVKQEAKLSSEQCTNISNSLLLLRNILHIPEDSNKPTHSVQNQILWNSFGQGIDKILIKLMTIPDANNWGVTMVQLIALLYKDQHVVTLHKLLNAWLEASLTETSEDNESNTSPPNRRSEGSSPMLTSDMASDSSDTGGSGKPNDEPNSANTGWNSSTVNNTTKESYNGTDEPENNTSIKNPNDDIAKSMEFEVSSQALKTDKKTVISENSDCGYGTNIENQESISTSSNEDELPIKKPVHQKPHNAKHRVKTRVVSITSQEKKRKKIVKKGKANIYVQVLSHKTPTDDHISNILKDFTVDFLLKGYNSLVQTLHSQILTNLQLEIDTSHFFWLVTYFLKFATQLELDLKHISSVLSYDIVSYLTAEGVNLDEQFELAMKLDGNDLKPSIRRLHLVVTAIREFVQAIEVYKKFPFISNNDQQELVKLQIKMCETEELRSLLVLLLRHYNPKYHSKQYLQDLIVTNHILLMFLDKVMKLPEYNGSMNMFDHMKQFATPEIMYQYGLLLEDYASNGQFVNDCIFTLMHHAGGELGCLISLFQPKILKAFTSIWKTEFEICDDWSDLIEYVINTFIRKPDTLQSSANFRLDTESFDGDKQFVTHLCEDNEINSDIATESNLCNDRWTEDELSSLRWIYMQNNTSPDVIGDIVKLLKEEGISKSRDSIIQELYKQNVVNKTRYEKLSNGESDINAKVIQVNKEIRDDEVGKLCSQLAHDGKSKFLDWVQCVLLETCLTKIHIQKKTGNIAESCTAYKNKDEILNFGLFKNRSNDLPAMSPVAYHSLNINRSVPLVPWNCEQAYICKDLTFLQLLNKLGFHMPVDTGKVFIRIPNFWTADLLYDVAGKIAPIDISKLKFSINDLSDSGVQNSPQHSFILSSDLDITRDVTMKTSSDTPKNLCQTHKQKQFTALVNLTPMPDSSFNCEEDDTNAQNWLEVVQKSQDCKKIINLGSASDIGKDDDVEMMQMLPKDIDLFASRPIATPASDVLTVCPKQDNLSSNVAITDSEYYNIECETASVASDLMYMMYVSDEDEKPMAGSRQTTTAKDRALTRTEQTSGDSDNASKKKRSRRFSTTKF